MPTSDELLLKLIYQEENQKLLDDAAARLEGMSDAEKKFMQYEAEDAKLLADEMKRLADEQDNAANSGRNETDSLTELNQGLELVQKGVETLEKAWDFAKEGAAINRINEQWAATAKDFGANGDQIISAINGVTGHTLDQEQVMQAASRTLTQGLVTDGEQIVNLFQIAQAMAVRFGGSAIDAYQAESMAIETGMSRQLRAQGITVDFTEAYKKYAEAHHVAEIAISDETKVEIRRNEVMEQGAVLVAKVGDAANDQVSKIQRLEQGWKEFIDRLKEGAADVVVGAMDESQAFSTLADSASSAADKLKAYQLLQKIDPEGVEHDTGMLDYYHKLADAEKAAHDEVATSAWNAIVNLTKEGTLIGNLADAYQAFLDKQQAAQDALPTNLNSLTPAQQDAATKQYEQYQTKLSDIELKGKNERDKIIADEDDQINQLESDAAQKRLDIIANFAEQEAQRLSDLNDQRISILMSEADNENKITEQENTARMKLAESFGIETERMEQDHQLKMQRLQEDHGLALRKLADSRDALGIEDENQRYNTQRQRDDQDYQIAAERRNQDYARQLADQTASFEAQRKASEDNAEKQLEKLQENFNKQDERYHAANQKQLDQLDDQTKKERDKITEADQKKLDALETSLESERSAANTQWTQWRNEHDIFFAGERQAYDLYLQNLHSDLQRYITSGGAVSGSGLTPYSQGSNLQGYASGGEVLPYHTYMVGERGPEPLVMGSRGGYVVPNDAKNGGGINITINGSKVGGGDKQLVIDTLHEVLEELQKS